MSWQEYRCRRGVIEAVLAAVEGTGRIEIPANWRQRITEVFGDEESFLAALGYRWLNALTARLDQICAQPHRDVGAAVHRVRRELAAEQPALAALLSVYTGRPALVTAAAVERERCAWVDADRSHAADTRHAALTA